MLAPFFVLAAVSPSRQRGFREMVAAHLLLLAGLAFAATRVGRDGSLAFVGLFLLTAGIVEGALLVGWRLTQLPKSQALEFLLVSPLPPGRLFVGEALVGLTLLALVTLSGLPVLAVLAGCGVLDPFDLLPLLLLPFAWGAVTGLGLTVWAYEPAGFRRVGEVVMMGLTVVYLVVGVLAGENLRAWLGTLPETYQLAFLGGFHGLHTHNPFGVMAFWLENDVETAWPRTAAVGAGGLLAALALLVRGAWRLPGHFHERHYQPARDVSAERRPPVGNRPLAWWAVKRVTEYSGRINLWLAGGFGLVYAAYLAAEGYWPVWMGRRVFQLCDAAGGPASLAAALVVLAAVPASFQYGLWDASAQERCRRLELLLLTRLRPRDYWDAAAAAAWTRGRGYFAVALLLWVAGWAGGRLTAGEAVTAAAAGVLLWGLYFALGFRAFARGAQANGLGLLLTVGLPLAAHALYRVGWPVAGGWLPPGLVYRVAAGPADVATVLAAAGVAAVTVAVARRSLAECDARLRRWYDAHHGSKVMT